MSAINNPTLCLNMIVKNESRIIGRLLESVYLLIDSYCICDTGSTDDTVSIIENFFASKNISGCIIHKPFIDFGTNRTYALQECNIRSTCDYILLIDADMVISTSILVSHASIKAMLTDDMYFIFQGTDAFFYKNCRVVKNVVGYSYWGVTHEYIKSPKTAKQTTFPKDVIFIKDMGDGGSKSNKYSRDILLLLNEVILDPNNDRYNFYLANTYHDCGDYLNAIIYYKKRIELGGWVEECWYSTYRIGNCYNNLGDHANAVYYWLKAYSHSPYRMESLYSIIKHYRIEGNPRLAYDFYTIANSGRNNTNNWDYLFLEKDVYEFKLDYELSIIGYYCKDKCENNVLINASMNVLSHPLTEPDICKSVLSNLKFYVIALEEFASNDTVLDKHRDMLLNMGNNLISEGFFGSTPTLSLDNYGRLIVGVRFVNYRIDDDGKYINSDAGTIITRNIIAVYDIRDSNQWKKIDEFELKYDTGNDCRYVGLEDIRLFQPIGSSMLYYNANRGLINDRMVVEHGEINIEEERCVNSNFIKYSGSSNLEKNWVLFDSNEPGENALINCVYKWYPLTIGTIDKSSRALNDITTTITPNFFQFMRGSTNGVSFGSEIWFMNHVVSYEDRRYYYHCIVVIDRETRKLKKYTPLMTFANKAVEYVLGLIFLPYSHDFMIGYSIMDCDTRYIMINKNVFDDMMISV